MKAVNELIKMGFELSVIDGNLKLESKGVNPVYIAKAKPLIEELKLHKEQAVKYIEKIIIYEINNDNNFDIKIQACHDDLSIAWLKIYIYNKVNKVVLIGQEKIP